MKIGEQACLKYSSLKIVSYNLHTHCFILCLDMDVDSTSYYDTIRRGGNGMFMISIPATISPFGLEKDVKFEKPVYNLKKDMYSSDTYHKKINGRRYKLDIPSAFRQNGVYYLVNINDDRDIIHKQADLTIGDNNKNVVSRKGYLDSTIDGRLFKGNIIRVFERHANKELRYFDHVPDPMKVDATAVLQTDNIQWHCHLFHLTDVKSKKR